MSPHPLHLLHPLRPSFRAQRVGGGFTDDNTAAIDNVTPTFHVVPASISFPYATSCSSVRL
ncbi:MAG: hypothetical protein LBK18_02565 [Prevotellaceae bacterium]|jgi:hypothetical protein|nr:hypothetical protein [Prevotellaceae bacterium]